MGVISKEKISIEGFALIKDCGTFKRIVYRLYNEYYAGCFCGTKKALIESIKQDYKSEEKIQHYIEKIHKLSELSSTPFTFDDLVADYHGNITPFKVIHRTGSVELLDFAIRHGYNISEQEHLLLRTCIFNNKFDFVEVIIDRMDKITELHYGYQENLISNDRIDLLVRLYELGLRVGVNDRERLTQFGKHQNKRHLIEQIKPFLGDK